MPRPIFVLGDCSGSMESIRDDTIGGYNSFVDEQMALNPDGLLTLWLFDHEIFKVYENVPLREAPHLTRQNFKPRGSTHLLDTIGEALRSANPIAEPPIMVIFTDGEENGSKKFTKAGIKEMIEQKTSEGWTFVYLGANQDAFAEAGSMGIAAQATMNYDVTRTPEAFRSLSATVSNYTQNV